MKSMRNKVFTLSAGVVCAGTIVFVVREYYKRYLHNIIKKRIVNDVTKFVSNQTTSYQIDNYHNHGYKTVYFGGFFNSLDDFQIYEQLLHKLGHIVINDKTNAEYVDLDDQKTSKTIEQKQTTPIYFDIDEIVRSADLMIVFRKTLNTADPCCHCDTLSNESLVTLSNFLSKQFIVVCDESCCNDFSTTNVKRVKSFNEVIDHITVNR